jgi:HEAT repeat protein
LQKSLKDKDLEARRDAVIALAEIGADSAAAVPDLIVVLSDEPVSLRPIAIYALGRIGTASKPAVPQLNRFLFSRNPHEKAVAAWALIHITPDAETLKSAVPMIVKALGRAENPEARAEFARTLGKYGSNFPEAKDALKAATKDSDENVRKAAEAALAELK